MDGRPPGAPGPPADPVPLSIEAMGAQGDGLARGPRGPVHVAGVLPGETVLARVDGERAELVELLTVGPERVAPPCPHFGVCGGCALQHWAPAPYLAWKAGEIALALARVGIETEILAPVAAAPGQRRRLALHARCAGRGAVIGFKRRRSWTLAPIETCVIADPRLVTAFPALARLAEPFLEHPASAPTLHVTATLTGLDIDVTGIERRGGGLSADARTRIAGLAAEADFARVTLAGEVLYQAREALVRLGPATVALPPGAFLQAVPAAQEAMTAFILAAAAGARRIADLHCGVGTFSFALASLAPVRAVDASASAIGALRAAQASAPGLKPIAAEVRDLDRRPLLAADLARTDVVVFDPPRAGARAQCEELVRPESGRGPGAGPGSGAGRVVGVSCHLATFARDAEILTRGGFRLQRVLPVDQFLFSPHIELVGVFSR